MTSLIRRRLLAAAAALPVIPAFAQSRPLTCGELTAAQTEGPFFKTQHAAPGSRWSRRARRRRGSSSPGRSCRPSAGRSRTRCSISGTRTRTASTTTAAFATAATSSPTPKGRYRLVTNFPAEYPGAARHIHVKMQAPGKRVLTTQLYFRDEPGNRRDGLYRPDLEMRIAPRKARAAKGASTSSSRPSSRLRVRRLRRCLAARGERLPRQHLEAPRGDDVPVARIDLVVALDVVEAVDVVHHQARRAAHPHLRDVAEPVQPFHARAVAEVEARHRIERIATLLRVHQVVARTGARAGAACPAATAWSSNQRPESSRARSARTSGCSFAIAASHLRNPGIGRERGEGLQPRKLAPQVFRDLLDEQVAEGDAAQALLAVGDRVEDRAVGRGGVRAPATRDRAAAARAKPCRASAPPR